MGGAQPGSRHLGCRDTGSAAGVARTTASSEAVVHVRGRSRTTRIGRARNRANAADGQPDVATLMARRNGPLGDAERPLRLVDGRRRGLRGPAERRPPARRHARGSSRSPRRRRRARRRSSHSSPRTGRRRREPHRSTLPRCRYRRQPWTSSAADPVAVRDDIGALAGYHSAQVDVDVRLNTNESPFPPPPRGWPTSRRELADDRVEPLPGPRGDGAARADIAAFHGVPSRRASSPPTARTR